ncbi:MAG: prohibitin family protein [Clostridia bacterium]|nr:prohibitin family protein [Clostridia bacterium]MBQ7603555.1 prohibitin family protein [Clostridia bacterium]
MKNIVWVIIAAIFAVAVISIVLSRRKGNGLKPLPLVIAALALVAMFIVPSSIHTVQAGEIAVVKVWGKAEYVRTAGTYFDLWISREYEIYDAKVQNIDIRTEAYSKDAQTMDINMTVQYMINTEYAMDIAVRYGDLSLLQNRVNSACIEKAKSVLSQYSAMTIIETRANISPEVERVIKDSISDTYYVNIVTVVLTDISFSDAFESTVEDKMIAEQEKLKAEYEKEKAIIEAEKELEVARLDAQAKIASAEGQAEAQIEIAVAEAKSIALKSVEVARMLGFTINEVKNGEETSYEIDFNGKTPDEIRLVSDYLRYIEYLSVWDGVLPRVMMGDGSGTVMIPAEITG